MWFRMQLIHDQLRWKESNLSEIRISRKFRLCMSICWYTLVVRLKSLMFSTSKVFSYRGMHSMISKWFVFKYGRSSLDQLLVYSFDLKFWSEFHVWTDLLLLGSWPHIPSQMLNLTWRRTIYQYLILDWFLHVLEVLMALPKSCQNPCCCLRTWDILGL